MQQYMVDITLPENMTEDFIQLIPAQRSFINKMFERGIITSYSLNLDRSKLWVTFYSATPEDVERVLRKFPIAEYITYQMHELMFHNSLSTMLPAVSLN